MPVVSKAQSATFLPGVQSLDPVDVSQNLGIISIPASGNTTRTVVVPFTRNDVISNMRINFTGTSHIAGLWFPLSGPTLIVDQPLTYSPISYAIYISVSSHPSGRLVTLQFVNNTAAPVNTPNLTVNIHAKLQAYPWE